MTVGEACSDPPGSLKAHPDLIKALSHLWVSGEPLMRLTRVLVQYICSNMAQELAHWETKTYCRLWMWSPAII